MSITVEVIGGVEVSVETGTARVLGLEAKARNVEVRLEDPVRSLRFPLNGWIDKADPEAIALAERVSGTDAMVSYRIEVHRDPKVSGPSVPMAEVPQTARFRRLVALTEVSAAPVPSPAPPPPPAPPAPEAMPWDDLPPARGDNGPKAFAGVVTRPGPRVQEARPWEAKNSDGSPNLGSYEVLAAVGMTELAHELMLARALEAGHQVWSIDTMRRLAHRLLVAADRVQAAVRTDGHADRMDGSHFRARGAVRTALKANPVPWEATAPEKAAWVEDLVAWATAILACAMELAQLPAERVPAETGGQVSGGLATEEERQAAIAASRQVDDSDHSRDARGDTDRDRLAQWMHAQGIPPLISRDLTSEQAMRLRAYLANTGAEAAA